MSNEFAWALKNVFELLDLQYQKLIIEWGERFRSLAFTHCVHFISMYWNSVQFNSLNSKIKKIIQFAKRLFIKFSAPIFTQNKTLTPSYWFEWIFCPSKMPPFLCACWQRHKNEQHPKHICKRQHTVECEYTIRVVFQTNADSFHGCKRDRTQCLCW